MKLVGNVLAVEPEMPIEAHVRRFLAFRFDGHAIVDLIAQDEAEVHWIATIHAPGAGQAEVALRAELIEDDQFLAFDLIDGGAVR
ncbi:hypothetical protein [Paracoccus simplex]|uniref:Uncharacterized protein n=1 Tax=Paracoccus simplex TaxID=2086346 RepID=A0ABV7S157_9RHOB